MTKDQGLYSKSSVAVHPGALAAGALPRYNTISIFYFALYIDKHTSRIVYIIVGIFIHFSFCLFNFMFST